MTKTQQRWINKFGTIMISYAIVAIFMLITRGWDKFDIALFFINAVNFVGFQFTEMELYQSGLIAIAVGLASIFLLPGLLIIAVGFILALYAIICMIVYYKK